MDVRDRRLDDAEHEPGREGPERRAETNGQGGDEPLQPEQRPGVRVDGLTWRGRDRGHHRQRPDEREGERDQQLDGDTDDPRALLVVGDRAQRAAVPRVLEEPVGAERQRDRQPGDEERSRLYLRPTEWM